MTITLTDGRQVDTAEIFFNPRDYSFTQGSRVITNDIRIADKKTFPEFDVETYNKILYGRRYFQQHGSYPPDLPTNVLAIFTNQIVTAPLDAPLEALDAGVKRIFQSTGVKIAVAVAVIGLVIYFAPRR